MSKIRVAYSTGTTLPIGKLKILQGDLKSLSDENFEKLKREIVDTGFAFPPHVWRDPKSKQWYLVDGTQRITALNKMIEEGFKIDEIPVVVVEAKNIQEAKRRVLQATSQYGQMTQDSLVEFMNGAKLDLDFVSEKFDLPNIDMEALKSNFLIHDGKVVSVSEHQRTIGLTDDDAVPEVKKSRVKLGDIWKLGDHRLMCGDSTDSKQVALLMGKDLAAVWASDPPYGINHVDVANEKGQAKGYAPIANDEKQDDDLREFILASINASLPFMKKGFAFYMWHAMKMQAYFSQAAAAAGILFHRQIIWVKPQFVFGRGQYHWRHELCLMGWMTGNEPPFYGERNQSTVWEIGRENDKIHPTQKPVAIWEPPILNHTKPGEIIYEPFAGSGSNIIACEKLQRRCYAIELSELYCQVIIDRWEQYTGKKAERIVEPKLRKQKRAELAAPR